MKDRKLTQLIMLLNKQECDDLGLFVRSPYFNKQEVLITLLDYFLKYYPDFDEKSFSEENSWSFIYPGIPFEKNKLAQFMTKLYKLINAFIHVQVVLKDDFSSYTAKSSYFSNKKSSYFFEKNQKDFIKIFSKISQKSPENYLAYYGMAIEQHNHLISTSSSHKKSPIYEELHAALDQHIIIEKLRIGMLSINQSQASKENIPAPFADEVLEYASKRLDKLPPLAILWYHAYSLFKAMHTEESYHTLKRFWLMNHQGFSSGTNITIVNILEFSVRLAFKNKRAQYMEELFSLYLMQVQQDWLIQQDFIQNRAFNNIVFVSLYLKKTEWSKSFIKDYGKYLLPESKDLVIAYNMARVEYASKEYAKCLRRIAQMDFIDTQMTIGSKRIQLKSYYELGENDLMESGINSLRVYLHRLKGVSDAFKDHHHLFTNVLNHLFKIKVGDKGVDNLAKVKEEVNVQRSIPEYDWIVDKIAELEDGK